MTHLPYFKFRVSNWLLGRIADQTDAIQGAFIMACCHFWMKKCDYTAKDFEKKIGKKRYAQLVLLEFILIEENKVVIPFLQEEFRELSDIQQKRKKGGLARAKHMHQHKHSYKEVDVDKDVDVEGAAQAQAGKINNEIELMKSESWHNEVAMHFRIKPDQVKIHLKNFITEQRASGRFESRMIGDLKRHFIHWGNKKGIGPTDVKPTAGTGGLSFATK